MAGYWVPNVERQGHLTVREVLQAAREAAVEIRSIEEQAQIRRDAIGVQGHGYGFHSKSGILDPTRKIDELICWEQERVGDEYLRQPIDEAWDVIAGARHISDDAMIQVVTRYYLQAESWHEIVGGWVRNGQVMPPIAETIPSFEGKSHELQVKLLSKSIDANIEEWESVGIAKLREMGRE